MYFFTSMLEELKSSYYPY